MSENQDSERGSESRGPREHRRPMGGERRPMGPRPQSSQPMRPRGNIPPDTILIGKKPLMAYATAVMMHFNMGKKELTVKARGRAISHAVDVVEVVRRRFFEGKLMVKEVKIGTEVVSNTFSDGPGGSGGAGETEEGPRQQGESRNVSTIEIRLERTD